MAKRNESAHAHAVNPAPAFAALLTPDEVMASERCATGSGQVAYARRATLATLTRSLAQLQEAWSTPEGAEAMFAAIELATEWRSHLKASAKLADAGLARLLLAGQSVAAKVKP